jgi:metallo-beta-lactamase class B
MLKQLALPLMASMLCAATPPPAAKESADPPSWTEPTAPFHVAGPIYYVGTRGIGVYLIESNAGLVLVSGAPGAATAAVMDSIRQLGFASSQIRLILSSHAHFDHAGTLAAFHRLTKAPVVATAADAALLASGGQRDFLFSNRPRFRFEPVKADRIVKDGETVTLGNVELVAHLTPGHTQGCTTWEVEIEDGGRKYDVVFADGTSVNPGTRFVASPSYPGIAKDYARTFQVLETLRPDIFLSYHAEFFDLEGKRDRARKEGIAAWVDTDGYRDQIAKRKAAFTKLLDDERKR